jgi:Ca2+-binding EF-hand superfamily protein
MDDSAIRKTREVFAMCDADGDGVITKAELFKLVKELGYANWGKKGKKKKGFFF